MVFDAKVEDRPSWFLNRASDYIQRRWKTPKDCLSLMWEGDVLVKIMAPWGEHMVERQGKKNREIWCSPMANVKNTYIFLYTHTHALVSRFAWRCIYYNWCQCSALISYFMLISSCCHVPMCHVSEVTLCRLCSCTHWTAAAWRCTPWDRWSPWVVAAKGWWSFAVGGWASHMLLGWSGLLQLGPPLLRPQLQQQSQKPGPPGLGRPQEHAPLLV